MNEYIESGILELYVFGRLSDEENAEVQQMAEKHEDVRAEIVAIEQAVINLSYSVAPYLSAHNYEKIRQQLIAKQEGVVQMPARKRSLSPYIGWAAAILLMFGLGFQYYKYNEVKQEAQRATAERSKFEQLLANLEVKNTATEKALAVVRDKFSTPVLLEGQQVAPEAYAKVYVNNQSKQIYVDVAGLPEPPAGKVYQVWALKLDPLTPTSIGIIDNAKVNNGIHTVEFNDAEAFGITLEPAGGSPSPTLDQLYTLGKV
jgi:anti-sigma-K factor RskA